MSVLFLLLCLVLCCVGTYNDGVTYFWILSCFVDTWNDGVVVLSFVEFYFIFFILSSCVKS